jgi:hypothetical protein
MEVPLHPFEQKAYDLSVTFTRTLDVLQAM